VGYELCGVLLRIRDILGWISDKFVLTRMN
jgi:hypothetical protein